MMWGSRRDYFNEAIEVARSLEGLDPDPDDNPEYTRALVEMIVDMFGHLIPVPDDDKRHVVEWLITRGDHQWEVRHYESVKHLLPLDLTGTTPSFCGAVRRGVCTRASGHTGRHAAGNGRHIVAVWV